MNLLVSTHCDLDAIGVVVLTEYVKNIGTLKDKYDQIDIWFSDYADYEKETYKYSELPIYDEIWYFDFTPDKKARDIIQENGIHCIVGDHHEGVKKEIEEWDYVHKQYLFDNDISGAKIYYKFLLDKHYILEKRVITEFIDRVSTYDLYRKTDPLWKDSISLNRLLYKSISWSKKGLDSYSYFIKGMLLKFDNQEKFSYSRLEEMKIKEDEDKENAMFKDCITGVIPIKTRKDSKGRYFCILKLSSKISILASRLLEHYSQKLEYVLVINTHNSSDWKLSVRSNTINLLDEFKDVAGHQSAAGYNGTSIPSHEYCEKLWTGVIWQLTLKE